MKKLVPLRQALSDPALLGDALPGDTWFGWRTVLIAAMGESLNDEERAVFSELTGGREQEPGEPVEVLLAIAGRRSGKSRALATLSVYLSALCDWSDSLYLGERGLCLYLAPTARQAGVAFGYAQALVDHVELLNKAVESRTSDCLTLRRSIDLTVQAASWRYSRGATCVAVCLDETAFFHNGEDAANSDEELMVALQPSLATTGGPMLIASSPSTMEGVVYKLHKRHFGKDGDRKILVLQSDSRTLNPSLKESVVARAYEADATAVEAEYGGQFREPVSAYLDRSIIEKAIEKGVQRRVPLPGIQYFGFLDGASGNGSDSYTMAIGHNVIEGDRTISIIDVLYGQDPPFDPDYVTRAAAATLKEWGLSEVYGDAYAGAWPIAAMARNGIRYFTSPLSASELYLYTLPLWTAGRVRMLDNARAIDQLCSLRRRVGQGVAEKVVHPRNGHDDSSNVIAGVLWRLSPVEQVVTDYGGMGVVTAPIDYVTESSEESETWCAWLRTQNYGRAPDGGLGRSSSRGLGVVW